MVIVRRWNELVDESCRFVDAIERVRQLDADNENDVEMIAECHLRTAGVVARQLNTCALCVAWSAMDCYEKRLYNYNEKPRLATDAVIDADGNEIQLFGKREDGNYSDSPLEISIKSLHHFVRTRIQLFGEELVNAADAHLKLIDAYKHEFESRKMVWKAISLHMSKSDEIRMAKDRFRFRNSTDNLKQQNSANIIDRTDIHIYEMENRASLASARSSLHQRLSKLAYLHNLSTISIDPTIGNLEECPICRLALGRCWIVLQCGHCLCPSCIAQLASRTSVVCPMCRQTTVRSNVSIVESSHRLQTNDKTVAVDDDNADYNTPIEGSYSIKIEAVVRRLRTIICRDRFAKSLVFSCWPDVLRLLSHALDENHISHRLLSSGARRQRELVDFRLDNNINVLLLPVSFGANGLNLTEASHVLFVEPLLNTANESQAIGRIDRIGQRRATTVHRFIVRDSIEERMHQLLTKKSDNVDNLDQWSIAHLQQVVSGVH